MFGHEICIPQPWAVGPGPRTALWRETAYHTDDSKIDHLAVQKWVTELGAQLAPATVAKCHQLLAGVLKSALRDRLIGFNPCEGVRLPTIRQKDTDDRTLTPGQITGKLLPAIPHRYRAVVGLSAGTGLRWGECVGLRLDAIDWDGWDGACRSHGKPFCPECVLAFGVVVKVMRVAVEVAGTVTTRPFPKSQAGRRTVPVPPFTAVLLADHLNAYPPGPAGEIFTNQAGGPLRRTLFRSRVWRPALVRAGLLGKVEEPAPHKWRATWPDPDGLEWHKEFATERDAVQHVVTSAAHGMRFHDLRHSFATWLVSSGVPINDVQRVMGHSNASVTLKRYTHGSGEHDARVRKALADFSLAEDQGHDDPEKEGGTTPADFSLTEDPKADPE